MPLHKAGEFDAVVINHGWSYSKNETLQFFVTFRTDGTEPITSYFSMSEKAVKYTVEKIRNLGFQGDDFDLLTDGLELAGNWCSIVIEHEEYNGKTYAKIKFVNEYGRANGPSSLGTAEIKSANLKRFNALLKSTKKANPNSARGPAERKSAPTNSGNLFNDNEQQKDPPISSYDNDNTDYPF